MTGPALSGLRVLDAASLYAAPLIATMLADHGADVVKLEPPGGDAYRRFPTRLWALVGRGKRSLVLDLDVPADRAQLHGLIPAVDVVVVNEPAHRLDRRGLDYATLSALNPALIQVHVSGYGLDGPYADRPGNGTLGEAFSGLTHMTGRPDAEPVLPSVPLGDVVTAFAGAFGVLVACYQQRVNGGPGQVIDVNPVDAMLHAVAPVFTEYDGVGEPPGRLASGLNGALLRSVFGTLDGEWVATSVSTSRQLRDLATLVGGPQLADAPRDEVESAFRSWVGARPRSEVVEQLVAARLPVAPVNTARDVLDDSHVAKREGLRTVHTAEHGPVTVPAAAPRLLGAAPAVTERLADVGEHSAEVLSEWSRR